MCLTSRIFGQQISYVKLHPNGDYENSQFTLIFTNKCTLSSFLWPSDILLRQK